MPTTKIICTTGPASSSYTVLRKMMLAGMDIARLNFSHGTAGEHQLRLDILKSLNKKYRRHIRILQDLEGYRIRIGTFKDGKGIELKKKGLILLTNKEKQGHDSVVPFDYEGALSDIKTGSHIYIDDGNILLVVKSRTKRYLKTEVAIPGFLKENKGINMPDVELHFKGLTGKDKNDIEFGIKNRVDYIAQSFVRDRDDILSLKAALGGKLPHCRIIAKIENRQGIAHIDRILDVCDGIMVARGDMGVSLPIYEVPMIQKMIIRTCNKRRKIVITATQMLESMTHNIRPTRAEVADVANAILDGTGYVMLSEETAMGTYPVETVNMMNQIILFTEKTQRKGRVDY